MFSMTIALESKYTVFLDSLSLSPLFLCPCMVIDVSVQNYGGFLPDMILLTDPMRLTSGNPFNTMKSFCPYSPPKPFDKFSPEGGC